MEYDFPVYQRVSGHGADFLCHVIENGGSRLVFSGATAQMAERAAMEWANRALKTPERLARIADRAKARSAARAKKSAA